MKLNTFIFAFALSIGLANAADYFKGVKRAKIFELSELNMPTIRLNFSKESYNRFQLTYKCLYDTHPLIDKENEDCFKAPWVNYTEIVSTMISKDYIDTSKLSSNQKKLVKSPQLSYNDFKSVISASSSLSLKEIFSQRHTIVTIPSFEENEASLDFIINGKTTQKSSIKFSIGGKYTQVFEKQQFNIKINDGDLYGRQQLRLRSETVDPSFLRSKVGYDLCNVLGLPSIQASYAMVYINNNNMGLYLLRDVYKPQWVESNYGIYNTTSLYKCDSKYGDNKYFNCVNDATETDDADYRSFIKQLESVKNAKELSKFFDTDLYIKWQAYKYITGSWDHVTNQHNQYLFKKGNKWMNLIYDFDSDFGAYKSPNSALSFSQESLELDFPIYKILELNDNNKDLVQAIKTMVTNGFNPAKLIPRIDELTEYLYPYVVKDRTPETDTTKRPGHIVRPDFKIENGFTVDDFVKNSEFHNYFLKKYYNAYSYSTDEIYGLKRWIVERFRFICKQYRMDCSFAKEYLEGGKYQLPSKDSTKVVMEQHLEGCKNTGYPCCSKPNPSVYTTDDTGEWSVEGTFWCLIVKEPVYTNDDCWSLERGYPCCEHATEVYYTSSNGKTWSVENGDWCGIRDSPA